MLDGEEDVLALTHLPDQLVPLFVLVLTGKRHSDLDSPFVLLGGHAQYLQIGKTGVIYG